MSLKQTVGTETWVTIWQSSDYSDRKCTTFHVEGYADPADADDVIDIRVTGLHELGDSEVCTIYPGKPYLFRAGYDGISKVEALCATASHTVIGGPVARSPQGSS